MDNTISEVESDQHRLPNVPITFNEIPESIKWMMDKLIVIEQMIVSNKAIAEAALDKAETAACKKKDVPVFRWLTVKELSEYLPFHPAHQTIYGWTSNNVIPYHKKGKRTFFRSDEIDEWMSDEKIESLEEMEEQARAFMIQKSKQALQSNIYRR